MKQSWLQRYEIYLFNKCIHRVLVDRVRDRNNFKKGRFTRKEAQAVVEKTKEITLDIQQDVPIPSCRSKGAARNIFLGAGSLALYRAILLQINDKDYATELATEVCWLSFKQSIELIKWIPKILYRSPQAQIKAGMKLALRFPFSRPDYDWEIIPSSDTFEVNFYECPVHEYFKKFGEEEMTYFRKNWCTQDFSIAEVMVENGRYERPNTLSDGDPVCNMKFFVQK